MNRKIVVICISILVTILIFYAIIKIGIEMNTANKKSEDGLKIVTTIFPYYDFSRAVVGNENNIHLLVKPGSEIHSYEPTPQDYIKIQNSDVFIYNGGENDAWVDEILKTLDTSKITVIKMMDYVDIYEENDDWIYTENEEESDELGYDEHIWTSPKNALKLIEVVSKKLMEIDEKNKTKYEVNSNKYIEQIQEIDREITEVVNKSEKKLLIFGDRFPFRYFIEEYGLKYRAAFSGCSTETEPSASTIASLIEDVNKNNIPIILYIELSSRKVADTISKETGAQTMCLQSCQNINKSDFDKGKTYVDIMRENIETLKIALY